MLEGVVMEVVKIACADTTQPLVDPQAPLSSVIGQKETDLSVPVVVVQDERRLGVHLSFQPFQIGELDRRLDGRRRLSVGREKEQRVKRWVRSPVRQWQGQFE